jgi:3-isopropylmalate dehydrogenase
VSQVLFFCHHIGLVQWVWSSDQDVG